MSKATQPDRQYMDIITSIPDDKMLVPVTFTWKKPCFTAFIVGDWNQWKEAIPLVLVDTKDAIVPTCLGVKIFLPEGKYQYKYLIDKKAIHDPEAPNIIDNKNPDNINNLLEVRAPHPEYKTIEKKALLIGCQSYKSERELEYSINDATAMSNKMSSLGWKCWTKTDLSFIDFATVLNNFLIEEPKKSKGPLLLYFSGHGCQINGKSYLLGVDADLKDYTRPIESQCISMDYIFNLIEKSQRDTYPIVIILDCCRDTRQFVDNTWTSTPSQVGSGKSTPVTISAVTVYQNILFIDPVLYQDKANPCDKPIIEPGCVYQFVDNKFVNILKYDNLDKKNVFYECDSPNVFIAHSTTPGQLSYEKYHEKQSSNSFFTSELLKVLDSGYDIDTMFRMVKQEVSKVIKKGYANQSPWTTSNLNEQFYFKDAVVHNIPARVVPFCKIEPYIDIMRSIYTNKTIQTTNRIFINGPPGIGKTIIASHIAFGYYKKFPYKFVHWVNCDSILYIEEAYRDMAMRMNIVVDKSVDVVKAVKERLDKLKLWMIVFDRVGSDTIEKINRFIPEIGVGIVIVTSRFSSTKLDKNWKTITLKNFDLQTSKRFVSTVLKHPEDSEITERVAKLTTGYPSVLGYIATFCDIDNVKELGASQLLENSKTSKIIKGHLDNIFKNFEGHELVKAKETLRKCCTSSTMSSDESLYEGSLSEFTSVSKICLDILKEAHIIDIVNEKFTISTFMVIGSLLWLQDKKTLEMGHYKKPVSPRPIQTNYLTPLQMATQRGCLESVKFLVDTGCDVNEIDDEIGASALHYATGDGDIDLCLYLLEKGASVDTTTKDGNKALDWASKNGSMEVALILGLTGISTVNPILKISTQCLHYAVKMENYLLATHLLIDTKCNQNYLDKKGRSALYFACKNGNIRMVCMMLDNGCDPNIGEKLPLHVAVKYQRINIIGHLILFKACINTCDVKGRRPIHVAIEYGTEYIVQSFIDLSETQESDDIILPFIAIEKGNFNMFTFLIKGKNLDVIIDNRDNNGKTFLHCAVHNGNYKIVEYLVNNLSKEKLIDVLQMRDLNGDTPVHYAVKVGNMEIMKLLTMKKRPNNGQNDNDTPMTDVPVLIKSGIVKKLDTPDKKTKKERAIVSHLNLSYIVVPKYIIIDLSDPKRSIQLIRALVNTVKQIAGTHDKIFEKIFSSVSSVTGLDAKEII